MRRALLVFSFAAALHAADWPQWRGPHHNGITDEAITTKFPGTGPKVLWQANVGTGFSSCSVAAGKLYTLGHAGDQDTVFCFDARTGQEIWKHSYAAELGDKYFEGGPTSTPTVSGGRVFTLGRWGDLFCFEAASGNIVWTKNIATDLGVVVPDWGFAGSPTVLGDLLLLNVGDGGTALEKSTGQVRWTSGTAESAGYSTPLPYQHHGKTLLTFSNVKGYFAINPADGKQAWFYKWVTRYGINAADPVLDDGKFFLSTGYGKGCALIDPTHPDQPPLWQNRDMRTQMNPCVMIAGHLYGIDGDESSKPELKCLDLATGKVLWKEPSPKGGGLIAAGDLLIILTGQGELTIAKASPAQYDPLDTAQVLSGKCWTAPALANGILYCRNAEGQIVALEVKPN